MDAGNSGDRGDRHTSPVDVIAVGASAGGLAVLEQLVGGLAPPFPVPVLVVQHVDPRHRSMLPEILARHTALPLTAATDGMRPEPGTVVVAVPGHHLVVDPDRRCRLTDTPPVRFVRPSVDVLLESVAAVYGSRAVAVVLTGSGSDGAMGALAVHLAGGSVIA